MKKERFCFKVVSAGGETRLVFWRETSGGCEKERTEALKRALTDAVAEVTRSGTLPSGFTYVSKLDAGMILPRTESEGAWVVRAAKRLLTETFGDLPYIAELSDDAIEILGA